MSTQYVDSLKTKTDVSGWLAYSVQGDNKGYLNGKGKEWSNDGSIYVGEYNDSFRSEGMNYELQAYGTHTLYSVKYDEGKEIENKEISKVHKIL